MEIPSIDFQVVMLPAGTIPEDPEPDMTIMNVKKGRRMRKGPVYIIRLEGQFSSSGREGEKL